MRIVVFGATGPTGRILSDQALLAGHQVTAVARRPEVLEARDGLTVVRGDVSDPGSVTQAVAGGDAVISVLGVPFSRQPITLYSRAAQNIVAAMHAHGVGRLITVSSSVTDPLWRPSNALFFNNVLDPLVNRRLGRTLHEDMRRMEALVRDSGLDWTIARPSGLFDHPPTGYEVAEDRADGLFTARADLAAAMLAAAEDGRFVRKAMAVITTEAKPNIAKLIWREGVKKNMEKRRMDKHAQDKHSPEKALSSSGGPSSEARRGPGASASARR
jgi:putative NADH-flavin reductase